MRPPAAAVPRSLATEPLAVPAAPSADAGMSRAGSARLSLPVATSFSLLLAAEQARSQLPQVAGAPAGEAVDAAVDRVLAKTTGGDVSQTARGTDERLIRKELERIEITPE